MKSDSQIGYLIIADISGYTSYVAKTEIQNAQALLAGLLTRIVEQFKPVVEISRLEGDAVFAYSGSSMSLQGETLMELIESTYVAFREGQEVYRRTLCDCEACQSLPTLELKFIIHHGEYAIQKVRDYRELIGSDVNLAHRLLKNHATEATGLQAYALITESALTQMNLLLDCCVLACSERMVTLPQSPVVWRINGRTRPWPSGLAGGAHGSVGLTLQ